MFNFRFSGLLSRLGQGRSLAAASIFAATLGSASPARADDTAFDFDGVTYNRAGGALLPCIKVAFDAPTVVAPSGPGTLAYDAQGRPVLTQSSDSGRTFNFHVAAMDESTGAAYPLFPPGPCRDGTCQAFSVGALASDGTHLLLHFDVTSPDGKLDPGTIRAFNPQPEPPGFPAGAMEVDFSLTGAGAATASITLTVLNQSTGRVVTVQ